MQMFRKRVMPLVLAFTLCATLFCGVWAPAQAATVDYVYSDGYVYNWGTREELATFLSPMAEDWYEENNTSYAELSTLSGSSSTSSVPSSELYQALHALMYDNLDNPTSYDATRGLFQYTDVQNSGKDSKTISSFYSGDAIGPEWDGGQTWNREHTWPNSKSSGGSDNSSKRETDIMMLRPTAKSENGSRSNKAYGESDSFYNPNGESNGAHDLRGDVARIVLYVYTCWGGSDQHDGALDYMWGSSGVIESLAVLLKWVEEDPVDTWELGRNDSVEAITGTRNVFVDYPELVFALFNVAVPANYDTPSGSDSGVTYTVTATSNNPAYGTVSVSGKTVSATPKSGYMVSGYEIISGTAGVTRDGDTFRISATTDVSIRINFAPRTQVTVRFAQYDSVVATQAVAPGDSITLPAHSGAAPAGFTFIGWVPQVIEDTTEKPTSYAAGSSYTVTASVTLYALYSRVDGGGSSDSDVFELVTDVSDLQIGDKVIVYAVGKNMAMSTTQNNNNRGQQKVTPSGNSITLVSGIQVITLEAGKTAGTYAFNVGKGYLYAASSSNNYLRTETTLSANSSWNISIASNGVATIKATGSYTRNWMRYNSSSQLFACYSSGQADIALYKQKSGATYYFTGAAAPDCAHEAAYTVAGKEATCAADGYTAGVYCPDCDAYISGHEEIPATGEHTYDHGCDATCNVCGSTRTPDDHVYTAACDEECDVCGAVRTVTAGGGATITFDSTSKRTEFSTSKQVWVENGITVTNNKGSSTSPVADYAKPARFYKSSTLIVEYPGMTSIAFTCNTADYAAALKNSIGNGAAVSGKVVTVALASVDVYTIEKLSGGQVRMDSITVTVAGASHAYASDADAFCNTCHSWRTLEGVCLYSEEVPNSRMEMSAGVGGLAYKYELGAVGVTVNDQRNADLSAATVTYGDTAYRLVGMGAVITNDAAKVDNLTLDAVNKDSVIDIPALILFSVDEDYCSFAVRITNIPERHYETAIYARPYCVIECEGTQFVVYDPITVANYANTLN